MIELYYLKQLIAFSEYKTLSKAAENLNISQPSLTRTMKALEEDFEVPLFNRTKNRIELNENGTLAVSYAKKILEQVDDMRSMVRSKDRASHTISIGSCAPMPLNYLLGTVSTVFPQMVLSSEIKDSEKLIEGLRQELYHIVILPYKIAENEIVSSKYGEEHLCFSLVKEHPKANKKGLYMKEIDGESMLVLSKIGIWSDILKKLPNSRIIMQDSALNFSELVSTSTLSAFASDITLRREKLPKNRIAIPILDKEATITFYIACLKKNEPRFKAILDSRLI